MSPSDKLPLVSTITPSLRISARPSGLRVPSLDSAYRMLVAIINRLIIIVSHDRIIHPHLPLSKGGLTPLWKRGARGDFFNQCPFNYETSNKMVI